MQKQPRILFWDIETSPILCWLWRPGHKISVSHEQIMDGQRSDIICISWKFLGESTVHSLDWGLKKQDSSRMVETFTQVIESADVIIAQNGDKFDMKLFNAQRLIHGQPPIAWPTSEDTLKQMRKYFTFPSYKLDYISKLLTGSGKSPMNFNDWIQIVQYKSQKHLDKMLRYNRRDVRKLEEVYKLIAPHCTPKYHAGKASGIAGVSCPRCASKDARKHGTKVSQAGRFQRYQCLKCYTCFKGSRLSA